MPHKVRIALDAMGGDHGAAVVVPGAELSLSRHPDIEFFFFSDTVAEKKEFDVGMAAEGQFRARNDHCCPMVAPHGVERNADFVGHGTTIPCRQESQQAGGQSPLVTALPFFQRS